MNFETEKFRKLKELIQEHGQEDWVPDPSESPVYVLDEICFFLSHLRREEIIKEETFQHLYQNVLSTFGEFVEWCEYYSKV